MEELNCFEGNEYDPDDDSHLPWDDMPLLGDNDPSGGADVPSSGMQGASSGGGDASSSSTIDDQRLIDKIIDSTVPTNLDERRQRASLRAFVQAAHRLTSAFVCVRVYKSHFRCRQRHCAQCYTRSPTTDLRASLHKSLREGACGGQSVSTALVSQSLGVLQVAQALPRAVLLRRDVVDYSFHK